MKAKTPIRIKKMLKDLKEGLIPIYGDRLKGLYLYGSYARGDYRRGSDVDVMILLSDYKNYWEELRRSTELASDISLAYNLTLSRLIMNETQWKESDMPVLRNIRKEGEPV
jgi:predicted nucleotidyltransferase